MTGEEAINKLRDMIIEIRTYCDESKHMGEDDRQNMETFDMAIKALEQEPRWIPRSERLPEDGEEVLVSGYDTYGKKVIIARYQGEQYGFTCGLVSAWMPLPKPYREVEE